MHWLYVIVIGFFIGVVAKWLMPGKDPGGFIVTTLIGIAGSMLATFLMPYVGWNPSGSLMRFAAAVGGSMLLLIAYRLVFKRGNG